MKEIRLNFVSDLSVRLVVVIGIVLQVLAPDFTFAHLNLAHLLGKQKRWDEAIAVCRDALGKQAEKTQIESMLRVLEDFQHAFKTK